MEDQRLSIVVQSQFCINVNQEAMSHSGYSVPCLTHLLQKLIGDQRPYQSKHKVSLLQIQTIAITPF